MADGDGTAPRELTGAEADVRSRRADYAVQALQKAIGRLKDAAREAGDSGYQARRDAAKSDAAFRRASESVADALAHLEGPHDPGVEAGDLPPREGGSRSVHAPHGIGRFAWMSDRIGATRARRQTKVSGGLAALGVGEKGLSSSSILQHLARAGWGSEQIGKYLADFLELTKTEGSIKQRTEVVKLLMGSIQHTEPRTLFEMKDVDLADLSDEEIDELTAAAARKVAEAAARLQAGLPADNVEG